MAAQDEPGLTSLSVATPTNPSNLPPRYEIRRLTPAHAQWAAAIVCHSNIYHGTIFPLVYPRAKSARFNASLRGADYLVSHQINSGLSLGVFDLEYKYHNPSSATTGGKFYFDPNDDDVSGEQMLRNMDFPLVSIALALDGGDPIDMSKLNDLVATLPVFATVYNALNEQDQRKPEDWKPEPGQMQKVLMRNGTSTRHEYEGQGLMGALARFMMRDAAARGFEAVNIECVSDAVTRAWSSPPEPFKGEVVAEFMTDEYEEKDEDGNVVNPFTPAKQRVTRVYTRLR